MKKKRKSQKKQDMLFLIALVMFFIIHNLSYCIQRYISDDMMNYIYERTIGFDFTRTEEQIDRVQDFLKNRDDILGYSFYEERDGELDNHSCTVSEYMERVLKPYIEKEINILDVEECVISKYFLDEDGNKTDMSKYIGKEITLTVHTRTWRVEMGLSNEEPDDRKYTFVVADVYDNIKAGENNKIYVVHDKMDEINTYAEGIKEGDDKKGEFLSRCGTRRCHMVLARYEDVDEVYNEFSDLMKERTELTMEFADGVHTLTDTFLIIRRNNALESVRMVMRLFIILAYTISTIILAVTVVNFTYKTKQEIQNKYLEIGILKTVGYQNREIGEKILTEYGSFLLKILVCSISVGTGMFSLIIFGIKKADDIFEGISFLPDYTVFLVDYGVIVAAFVIGFLVEMRKVKRANPSEILKSL